jgi:peptidoglycan/xylan/chitin deacetylase (PgdA/CDA1 family)
MLRPLKLSLLNVSRAAGAFRFARNTSWRGEQLLIICYHGISIEDEHEWGPGLYMTPEGLAGRFELLRRRRCAVLPLDEAVRRLYEGTLPPRSVALTFDDGNFDFYSRAWPLLKAYQFPATVYLTTYYCETNLPVFPLVVSYLLWKARGFQFSFPLSTHGDIILDTRSAEGCRRAQQTLVRFAEVAKMSAKEKDAFAQRLADIVDVDYAEIKRKRLMHLMNPAEVREVAAAGVDIQLHTHRHRSPPDEDRYRAEIATNRERIVALTGANPRHFCYPSGAWMPRFSYWLGEEGLLSATTTESGMARAGQDRFRLPRLLDHSEMTPIEFDAWLCGLGALLPHRPVRSHAIDADGKPVVGQFSGTMMPMEAPHTYAISATQYAAHSEDRSIEP